MLPNRFPDADATPEYNSVDASLWFVIAADAFLTGASLPASDRATLEGAIEAILAGYARGHAPRHPRATTTACSRAASPACS